jgi:hypothetical protein
MYLAGELPFEHHQEWVRQATQDLITSKSEEIVGRFCFRLMRNPATVGLLSQHESESRLKRSIAGWLGMIFDHKTISADPQAFVRHQADIGLVQSRENINLALVNYAKLMLKRIVEDEIEESHSNDEALMLSRYATEMIDYAVDLFNDAYRYEVSEMTRQHQASSVFLRATNAALLN